MRVQRRGYVFDFTYNAVKLTDDPEWTVKDVAENPGIAKGLLYKWKHEFRAKEELDFPWNGRVVLTGKEKKIPDLEKWIKDAADLQDEREFSSMSLALRV